MLELVDAVGMVVRWLRPDEPERAPADRSVPRFSLGGQFERHSIRALLRSTEAFEPLPWWKRRRIDGRRHGRVGVRSFRVLLTRALIVPVVDGVRILAETAQGEAFFGPLPAAFAHAWVVPRRIELIVCGRVIEGWRPRGRLRAARVPTVETVGYAPSMVATLGPAEDLPEELKRWFAYEAGERRTPGGRPVRPGAP